MEFDIAIKVEAIADEIEHDNQDHSSICKLKQDIKITCADETPSYYESLKIKTELSEMVCDGYPNLYTNHLIKEEIVIGPTELYKQKFEVLYENCKPENQLLIDKNQYLHCEKQTSVLCEKEEKKDGRLVEKRVANTKKEMKITKNANKNMIFNRLDSDSNKCLICFKTFTFNNNLLRHMKQFHINKIKKEYGCDKCDMSFSRSDYLIRHKLVRHLEGKQILYCECGNKFFNKWSLTRHRRGYCVLKSAKIRKLYCDYCSKCFCNKYRLTEHIKKHLNNKYKTLICEYCEKHFHRKFEIERHMLQHLGVSLHKFQCKICSKKFTRNWGLKKHLISHTGTKPFSCKYCERTFASKWGCSSHEKQCCLPENNNYQLVKKRMI